MRDGQKFVMSVVPAKKIREITHRSADEKKAVTECLRGHAYTPENTGIKRNGTRFCRDCRRGWENKKRDAAWWREWRKKREKRNGKWVKKQA